MKQVNKQAVYRDSILQALKKLAPAVQVHNPVMFIVYIGAIFTTILFIANIAGITDEPSWYVFVIALILWFTVLFANFAEAIAEGRGRAQAESLKKSRKQVIAHKLSSIAEKEAYTDVSSSELQVGDICYVKTGEIIPMDGEVIEGIASVDESAITGESAPVIRESGGDRSAVTGGTTVVSDWIVLRVTAASGASFLDKMIAMVEGAARKKTPNEIALQILLITLTIIFLMVCATLLPISRYVRDMVGQGSAVSLSNVVALLVCLAPTTIGALLSSIGIAGMSRLNQANVLAMSGRAIEAAGDVDVLLLDKTGTITLGNRQAVAFQPVQGVQEQELAEAAQLSSLADETAEGRSIVVLAKKKFNIREHSMQQLHARFIEFSARTRMSGIDMDGGMEIRKGAADAIRRYVEAGGNTYPKECEEAVQSIAEQGGTPLVVAKNHRVLGVIYLKDIVKDGIQENFEALRKSGIKTIMITGDNPMTAAAIAAEAGVDDFVAEATPETKLELIREYQRKGHLVAKEAGNMVDLDSSPTKLIEVVRIGKQLLMTRGALTTFSIANDVAKYFAIIPVLFMGIFPNLAALNIMHLTSTTTAILSAVIYNAFIIIALIPLSLRGVKYRELPADKQLRHNLMIYGVGGIILPFIVIKLIDMALTMCGIA